MDFASLVKGNTSIKNKLSLNVYNAFTHIDDKKEWTWETIKDIYLSFVPFKKSLDIPNSEYFNKLFCKFCSDKNGYSIYKFLFNKDNFDKITSSIFSIFLNRKLYENNESPIIIQPFHYKKLIKSDFNEKDYIVFISKIRNDNEKYYIERPIYSFDEIESKIKTLDYGLLDFLNVIDIRIFSSYYNTQDKYSDIDFLVVTDDKNCDLELTSALLGKSFTDLFGNFVDIYTIDSNKILNKSDFMVLLNSKFVRKVR